MSWLLSTGQIFHGVLGVVILGVLSRTFSHFPDVSMMIGTQSVDHIGFPIIYIISGGLLINLVRKAGRYFCDWYLAVRVPQKEATQLECELSFPACKSVTLATSSSSGSLGSSLKAGPVSTQLSRVTCM